MSELTLGQLRELAKKHGKEYGREFILWAKENGILKKDIEIYHKDLKIKLNNAGCNTEKEYDNKCAQKLGYKNYAERIKESRWNKGISSPASENEDCNTYFGIYIAENYVMKTFEDPIKAPPNNPGFDWLCKNGKKIEHKAACLIFDKYGNSKFHFPIEYNNIADYFILSGWNNREDLEPMYIWMYYKDDIVRGRKFWRRDSFPITNKPKYLEKLKEYEIKDKLDKLKELCNRKNDEIGENQWEI